MDSPLSLSFTLVWQISCSFHFSSLVTLTKRVVDTILESDFRRQAEEQRMAELDKQRLREEQRKEKHLKKLREKEQQEMSSKIRSEEKKLLIAQRKLESIRVLEALFDRIKVLEVSEKKSTFYHQNHFSVERQP